LAVKARWATGLMGFLCAALPAQAQTVEQEISAHRFAPAAGPRNLLVSRGARSDGHMAYSAGAVLAYAQNPFTVTSCPGGVVACSDAALDDVHVVKRLLSADLLASFTPLPVLQLGLRVPLLQVSGDGLMDDGQPDPTGDISKLGLGDVEIEAKLRAWGEVKDPYVLGAALVASLPTGSSNKFVSSGGSTVGVRAIVDSRFGDWSVLLNVAPTLRQKGQLGTTDLGSELQYSGGLRFPSDASWSVMVDAFGNTRFSSDAGSNALEVDAGLSFEVAQNLGLQLGGGASPISGVGAPDFRAFAGIRYLAEVGDRDGDGVADADDRCPLQAEDQDDHEDEDGCPDLDEDGDRIVGVKDLCPADPEDDDDFKDEDGCPEPDNDNDGIHDYRDRCPNEPENNNGFQDQDGCPDKPDTDHDGLSDSEDRCPSEAEDTDGFDDDDGCIDPDNDGDGVLDAADECPDRKETHNGRADSDGCPD
jgi:hypothetical protein